MQSIAPLLSFCFFTTAYAKLMRRLLLSFSAELFGYKPGKQQAVRRKQKNLALSNGFLVAAMPHYGIIISCIPLAK
jgi:hypothetical protein